jgi:hypothetical protein
MTRCPECGNTYDQAAAVVLAGPRFVPRERARSGGGFAHELLAAVRTNLRVLRPWSLWRLERWDGRLARDAPVPRRAWPVFAVMPIVAGLLIASLLFVTYMAYEAVRTWVEFGPSSVPGQLLGPATGNGWRHFIDFARLSQDPDAYPFVLFLGCVSYAGAGLATCLLTGVRGRIAAEPRAGVYAAALGLPVPVYAASLFFWAHFAADLGTMISPTVERYALAFLNWGGLLAVVVLPALATVWWWWVGRGAFGERQTMTAALSGSVLFPLAVGVASTLL